MNLDFTKMLESKTCDRQALIDALAKAGGNVSNPKVMRCPFHDDKNASAGIYEKDGQWRFKCHGCQMNEDWFGIVAESSGLHRNEVIKQYTQEQGEAKLKTTRPSQPEPEKQVKTWPNPKAIYDWLTTRTEKVKPYRYTDASNKDVLAVFRCEPAIGGKGKKGFIQATPYKDGWALQGLSGKLPLYNQVGIKDAESVVVVEGEKAADALIGIGICATTAPGGAGKDAADVDWSPLEGRPVYLWPDNDEPGRAHMERVAKALEHVAESVVTIKPAAFDLPEKGDAYDAIASLREQGADDRLIRKTLIVEFMEAKPDRPSDLVADFLEEQIAGRYRAVPFEFRSLSNSTKAMLPGTVTVICGDPNDGKSFLLLQCANYWQQNEKTKVAIYELEDDKRYHLMRATAQHAGNSKLLNDIWVMANPDDARDLQRSAADAIDDMGRQMWDAPDRLIALSELSTWVEARCKEGYRIIAIDPITATSTGEARFQDDLDFVITVKILARRYEVSIILITHPKKGRKNAFGLDELAGGAAYSRFTHTVLWIKRHKKPEMVTILDDGGLMGIQTKRMAEINRTMHLSKVRNGPGAGRSIGFMFDHETLRFKEIGFIVDEKDDKHDKHDREDAA